MFSKGVSVRNLTVFGKRESILKERERLKKAYLQEK
jgi:hypothetical protein